VTCAIDLRSVVARRRRVVGDDQLQGVGAVAEEHARVGTVCVLDDVGERLLHDAKRRQVDSLRQRAGVALDGQRDI
jgi:hypothetical protein